LALEALITKPEVERRLLLRLRRKAGQYAVDFAPDGSPVPASTDNVGITAVGKGDIESVVGELYEKYVIPLTKDVEVSGVCCSKGKWSSISLSRWITFCKD
jgi:chorismate mutase